MLGTRSLLLSGAALFATPVLAQDAPAAQTVTPPPIMVAPPASPAPAAQAPSIQMAPQSPVVQSVPDEAQTETAPAEVVRTERTTTRQASRPARPVASVADPAPAAAAAAPVAAPAGQTPAAQPVAPAAAPAPATEAPDTAIQTAQTTRTTQTSAAAPIWPWAIGLLVVLGGIAALIAMRRRRRDPEERVETRVAETPRADVAEPVAATPIVADPRTGTRIAPAIAPILASAPRHEPEVAHGVASVAHAEAALAEPAPAEIAAIADAPAPVANRPWLEFGLRPVRAGTSEEEALVDVELTVGNAGDTAARDVRISTFLLADADGSEMERMLLDRRDDAAVPPVTIAPGDGTRVDAHLVAPKGELGRTFNPVVVAEARYVLPDGREGRTSAAFRIGRPAPSSDHVGAIGATRPHMVDDVEAELIGTPEHA